MSKAIDIYLEKSKTRQYVGRLSQYKKKFIFEYDKNYLYSENSISIGPDLPLKKDRHSSSELFPSFEDRIPHQENPAYKEYCQDVGIDSSEKNFFILLSTLGKKSPINPFVCELVREKTNFSAEDLRSFRKNLGFSIREFAFVFDVSPASIYRIENGKTTGRDTLKKIANYFRYLKLGLNKVQNSSRLNESKKKRAVDFLRSKIQKAGVGPFTVAREDVKRAVDFLRSKIQYSAVGPFTVTSEDVQKCSPKQAVELLKRLMQLECVSFGIPQNNFHISSNLSAPDGGQDGIIKWNEGPEQTNFFPKKYNVFQVKAKKVSPNECQKEISNFNPAVQNMIKNKGAYILFSTYPVAGIHLQKREKAMQELIEKAGYDLNSIEVKFYDANIIANWLNSFPSLAVWFLKEVCKRQIYPWLSWQEWSKDIDHQFECRYHEELKQKRSDLYNHLSQYRQTAHLTGPSGVGKTRLALEVFRSSNERESYKDDISALVLYSPAHLINETKIRELKHFRSILIIDDCPLKDAEIFHKLAMQKDSKLSLLTIGHEAPKGTFSTMPQNQVLIMQLKPDKNIVTKMLSESQNIKDIYIAPLYIKIAAGFPRIAQLLKNAGPLNNLIKDDMPTIRKKMLWGLEKPDKEAEEVIKICSLFDTICIENRSNESSIIFDTSVRRTKQELEYLAKHIAKMDYNKFYEKIRFFTERKMIQQHGRFIQVRPKLLAFWLAKEFIEKTPLESIIKWLLDMDQVLIQSFCEQINYLIRFSKEPINESTIEPPPQDGHPEIQKMAQQLCRPEGLFGQEKILSTRWGAECFYNLADLAPKEVLESLKKAIEKKEELFNMTTFFGMFSTRRQWIWILQKLAVKKEFYLGSSRLLLKLAEAENENYSNHATGIWVSHFQPVSSGTEADPETKFQNIEKIKKEKGTNKQKEIVIKALEQALPKDSYIGISAIVGHHKEWRPITDNELWNYHRKALKYLAEFATDPNLDNNIRKQAEDVIARYLPSLIKIHNLHKDVEETVKKVMGFLPKGFWPSAIQKIEKFLEYQSKKETKETINKTKEILKLLKSKTEDINKKIRLYVSESNDYQLYDPKKQNDGYSQIFTKLIDDFINHIQKEKPENIRATLKILFHGKQNNTIVFSREVAKKIEKSNSLKFMDQILKQIKSWKKHPEFNPSFLCGFISGLKTKMPEETQTVLNKIALEYKNLLLPVYHYMDLYDKDITRLIQFLKQNPAIALKLYWCIQDLSTAKKCKKVSVEKMKELINFLLNNKNVKWIRSALQIYIYYVGHDIEKKKTLLPTLFQILINKDLLTNKGSKNSTMNRDYTMSSYYYKIAVTDLFSLIEEGTNKSQIFAQFFVSTIWSSRQPLYDFCIDEYYIKEIFKQIIEKYPNIILSEVANNSGKNRNYFNMRSLFKHEKIIKKWCKKEPKIIPVFLAKCKEADLLSYNEEQEEWIWSPLAEFLFDNYGDQKELTNAVAINLLNPGVVRGGYLNYYETIKNAMMSLKDHRHKNIRDFCEDQISYLQVRIDQIKQKEIEREELDMF